MLRAPFYGPAGSYEENCNAGPLKFSIGGVGGVVKTEDYKEYRDAGADSVMTSTGAMWNPYLVKEIKEEYSNA